MYKADVEQYLNDIRQLYDNEDDRTHLNNLFGNLMFKLEKNLYHLNNIKAFVQNTTKEKDFFELMPIYFEVESLFVSLRSTIDMNLHLINFCLDLKIPSKEIYMQNIYRSNLPKPLKDIFNRYTTKHNNPVWNFIYIFRNEIVHENSVFQKLPLHILEIEGTKYLFAIHHNKEIEIQDMFVECIKFLDQFINRVLSTLELYLKETKK